MKIDLAAEDVGQLADWSARFQDENAQWVSSSTNITEYARRLANFWERVRAACRSAEAAGS